MKRFAIPLLALGMCMLVSCFEFVGTGTAKRTLQLALAAPGDVAKLHIGVFEGSITPETMLYNNTVAAGSSIPLDLPSGTNRFIVVWAEGYDGIANYYGSIGPVIISENNDIPMPITMQKFNNNLAGFNLVYMSNGNQFTWKSIPGALTYEIIAVNDGGLTFNYVVTGNSYNAGNIGALQSRRIRVLTSVFNLMSTFEEGSNF